LTEIHSNDEDTRGERGEQRQDCTANAPKAKRRRSGKFEIKKIEKQKLRTQTVKQRAQNIKKKVM